MIILRPPVSHSSRDKSWRNGAPNSKSPSRATTKIAGRMFTPSSLRSEQLHKVNAIRPTLQRRNAAWKEDAPAMSKDPVLGPTDAMLVSGNSPSYAEKDSRSWPAPAGSADSRHHPLFRILWFVVNGTLVLSVFFAIYSTAWEYSTRRYLTGFSDAIVPETSPGDEKIEAILNWMAPGRSPDGRRHRIRARSRSHGHA